MAKYSSLLEIRGKIDDLVFYKLNGVQVVRKKSGFSKEAYKTNPNYQKVRENSSEFGHASKSGKMLRTALQDYLKQCEDKYLYQKFAKLMTQIKDLDIKSERGKRKIQIGLQNENSYQLLINFKFGELESANTIAVKNSSFFTTSVQLRKSSDANSIELITLKPDFENYITDYKSQSFTIKSKQNIYEFEKQFPDDDETSLLYFLVLKKGDAIVNLGFI